MINEYVRIMSALPPKADIVQHDRDVRFVPKADIAKLPELNCQFRKWLGF
jgi:hypothetical protein